MELYPIDIAIHLVNIVILYIILRVLLWNPVRKFMAAREDRVQAQMDEAARLQAEAQKAKEEYEHQLSEAKEACEQLMADGRKQAMASSQKYIDGAKEEAKQIVAQARTMAKEEKMRALEDAKCELSEMAVEMARRVMQYDKETRDRIAAGKVEKNGVRGGTLKTAEACSAEEIAKITAQLENLLGCSLKLETAVDPKLVGGYAAYVDGRVYDFSYAAQLDAMKQRLA